MKHTINKKVTELYENTKTMEEADIVAIVLELNPPEHLRQAFKSKVLKMEKR